MAPSPAISAAAPAGVPYRWVVLTVGTVAQASVSAVILGVAVLAPELRAHFDLSLGETGVVLAAVGIGMTPTLLAWGLLADKAGERLVIPLGLAAAAAALAASGFVNSSRIFILLLVAAGAFGASVNAASGRAVMQWFPRSERGLALGIRQANVPVGGLVSALALPPLAASAGVGWAFFALGAGCGVCAVCSAVLLRDASHREPQPVTSRPLRDPATWRISWSAALLVVGQTATMSFTVLFLHTARGFSTGSAAAVLAGAQVLGACTRVGAGHWSDRLDARIVPMRHLALGITGTLVLVVVLTRASTWLLVPALVCAGGVGLSWNGLSFTAAAEIAGSNASGAALGLQQTVLGLGGTIAPIGFANVVSATSWRVAFLLAGVFPLLGWIMLRPLAERRG